MLRTSRSIQNNRMRGYNSTADMPVAPALFPFPTSNQLYYDASLLTGLSDGDSVSSLTDFSGNENIATPYSTYDAPVYKTGIMNELPVLRFNGSSSLLVSTSNSFANVYTQNITIAVAYIPRAGSVTLQRYFGMIGETNEYGVFMARANVSSADLPEAGATDSRVADNVASATGTLAVDTPVIAMGVWNGSNVKYYQNGTLQNTTTFTSSITGATSNTEPWLIGGGGYSGTGSFFSQVDIAGIAVWDAAYTGTDLATINTWFTNKWNP